MLKTVLEDAKGSRLEGISFGDVKADLHYTESKDTVCLLYYPEINEFQGRMEKKTDLHCASAVLILAGVSSTVWSAYQSVWLRTA